MFPNSAFLFVGAGILAGAMFVTFPAYQVGKWVESSQCQGRIEAAITGLANEQRKAEEELLDRAARARLDADDSLRDDGFRRD